MFLARTPLARRTLDVRECAEGMGVPGGIPASWAPPILCTDPVRLPDFVSQSKP